VNAKTRQALSRYLELRQVFLPVTKNGQSGVSDDLEETHCNSVLAHRQIVAEEHKCESLRTNSKVTTRNKCLYRTAGTGSCGRAGAAVIIAVTAASGQREQDCGSNESRETGCR
jgi:hypothetical protein